MNIRRGNRLLLPAIGLYISLLLLLLVLGLPILNLVIFYAGVDMSQQTTSSEGLVLTAPREIAVTNLWGGQCPIVLTDPGPHPISASVSIMQDRSPHSVLPAQPIPVVTIDAESSVSLTIFLRVELDYYEGLYYGGLISYTGTGIFLVAAIIGNESMSQNRVFIDVDVHIVIIDTNILVSVAGVIFVAMVILAGATIRRRHRLQILDSSATNTTRKSRSDVTRSKKHYLPGLDGI